MRLTPAIQSADKKSMQVFLKLSQTMLILCAFIFAQGCNKKKKEEESSTTPEAAYCTQTFTYSSPVTISGTANYEYRSSDGTGLGAVHGTPNPIRYAEVRVYNSSGALAQCAETDGSGQFSFQAPNGTGTWTVVITSRAYNSQNKASVLKDPTSNAYHYISDTFTPNATQNIGTITAPATGSLEGGAFFILDKILDTNTFLVNETSGCTGLSGTFAETSQNFSCTPYTPTYKANVYWKPGFNPNTYLGDSSSGLSFFIPSQGYLYILGGIGGDTDAVDTDHFDASIIIHEYGHFLEHYYSKSDSPGGSHDLQSAIDPRLAWSEGWANFLQAAVTGVPFYRDTVGNASGNKLIVFNVNTEYKCWVQPNGPGSESGAGDCKDIPGTAGEGNFREFSITRALWDAHDNASVGDDSFDNANGTFDELWTAFTALRSLTVSFRNYGLFQEIRSQIGGATDFSAILGNENQVDDRTGYATPVTLGACAPSIPTSSANAGSSAAYRSFDYYHYKSSGGNTTIRLQYNPTAGGARDMDLFVLRESHYFFDDYVHPINFDISDAVNFNDSTSDGGDIQLPVSLAAGNYLIVVQYYSGPANLTYELTVGGQEICP